MSRFESWGRYPQIDQQGLMLQHREDLLPTPSDSTCLPFGNGRSYGDSCLNAEGLVLGTRKLDRFIAFDRETGVIRCEAGVLLSEILDVAASDGWFLPVTPGTKFVTVGGAIANDVHGKNHHRNGTFGRYVRQFELLRSSGDRLTCSETENQDYFQATIGGLGLSGLITWAELSLMKVPGLAMDVDTIRFDHVDQFFDLSEESDSTHEYTVAWVDCCSSGDQLGRGVYTRANHAESQGSSGSGLSLSVPLVPPLSLIRPLTVKIFNALYFYKDAPEWKRSTTHFSSFMYPLDRLSEWNRIYGPSGFLQYQFVLPWDQSRDGIREILTCIAESKMASTLAVLKICGDVPSPGILSFPMHGVSLALDFPFIEGKTLPLLERLDAMVIDRGGRLYPAKDAHMDGELFKRFYPDYLDIEKYRDPKFMSSMWRRVVGGGA